MHVTEELELWSLGALTPADAARVSDHVERCPTCREQAHEIEGIVFALTGTLPERDVPPRLRDRVLASARAELAARPPVRPVRQVGVATWRSWRRPAMVGLASLTFAVAALALVDMRNSAEIARVAMERDQQTELLSRLKLGGRTWYMSGKETWSGSGGALIAPGSDELPFVLFHDLRPLDPGKLYTVWLVSPDNSWVRGATFRPDGKKLQAVDLSLPIVGYDRCAVTIEEAAQGRKTGPTIMESRLGTPEI